MQHIIVFVISLLAVAAVLARKTTTTSKSKDGGSSSSRRCRGNLILGAAVYRSFEKAQSKLQALACSRDVFLGNSTDIVVLINENDNFQLPGESVAAYLRTINVDTIPLPDDDLARLRRGEVHLMNLRMILYHRYLRDLLATRKRRYCHVVVSDIPDAFLQGDPFAEIDAAIAARRYTNLRPGGGGGIAGSRGDYLLFAMEGDARGEPFSSSPNNREWVAHPCWGSWKAAERADLIANRTISCAGTTFGSHAGMIHYLKAMQDVWRENTACLREQIDQATHNMLRYFLLPNLTVPVYAPTNLDSPAFSLHFPWQHYFREHAINESLYHFDVPTLTLTIKSNGRAPPLVHQYDRDNEIAQTIRRHYHIHPHCLRYSNRAFSPV